MRRLILALSGVAALLLGLEKVGLYQFVPGGNTGLTVAPLADHSGYSLHHSNGTGNLTSWVQLIVRTQGSAVPEFAPLAWSGDPLAIVSRPLGAGRVEVTISKRPNPPQGTPFVWGAGLELRLVETIPNVTTTVEDWTVFPSTQAPDSLQFAARRHLWTMISWVLLSIAALGVALTALKKDAGEAVTARTLVGAIVNDIVGETKTETNKLRAFMKKVVLEEVPADQALTQAGYPKAKGAKDVLKNVKRFAFQTRAVDLFLKRVDIAQKELERYKERLSPK